MLSPATRVASSASAAPGAPAQPPVAPVVPDVRRLSETESFRWARRAVAIAIPLLGVVTITTRTVAFDSVLVAVSGGQLNWGLVAGTSFLLLIVWFMGLSLRSEHQRTQELATLLTVSRSVASPLEMNALLDAIFDALALVLDYTAIAVLTLNETRDTLMFAHMRAASSHRVLELQRTQYAVRDLGPAWDQLCNDEPVLISDVNKNAAEAGLAHGMAVDEDADIERNSVRSLMWIPLVVHERIVGILSISSATANAFGARDTALALGIGRQAAVEARAGLAAEFACEGDQRLSPESEQELYRVPQEALNNVLKHAHAARVSMQLAVMNDTAKLEIADDGVGFEPALRTGDGFGLPGMHERVERLGGRLSIESSPGAGARIHVEVPA